MTIKQVEQHSFLIKFIPICFGIFISFLLAESALRILEYYQYAKPDNRIRFEQYTNIYSDERDKDYVFGHKPNVNVLLQSGGYNYAFVSNSEGLREKKDYNHLNKSVIFLGDSVVEGASVENDETMDEVFERETGIVSLNFGVGSSNTVQEYYWLKGKYKKEYNAKLVILGFCLNDMFQNNYLRRFDEAKGNWVLHKYLDHSSNKNTMALWPRTKYVLRKSRLLSLLYRLTQQNKVKTNNALPIRSEHVSKENKAYTEFYIKKLKDFTESIGSDFVVIIFPQERQLKMQDDDYEKIQDILIEILQRNKIQYIDLYDVMREKYLKNPEVRWYHDDTHPYKAGHKFIGEYLASELPKIFPEVFDN